MLHTREEQREDERRYQGDVEYAVWRSGGNSDAVDRDRVQEDYHAGLSADQSAQRFLRRRCVEPEPEEADHV